MDIPEVTMPDRFTRCALKRSFLKEVHRPESNATPGCLALGSLVITGAALFKARTRTHVPGSTSMAMVRRVSGPCARRAMKWAGGTTSTAALSRRNRQRRLRGVTKLEAIGCVTCAASRRGGTNPGYVVGSGVMRR